MMNEYVFRSTRFDLIEADHVGFLRFVRILRNGRQVVRSTTGTTRLVIFVLALFNFVRQHRSLSLNMNVAELVVSYRLRAALRRQFRR